MAKRDLQKYIFFLEKDRHPLEEGTPLPELQCHSVGWGRRLRPANRRLFLFSENGLTDRTAGSNLPPSRTVEKAIFERSC
jgi:hypothetical protein